MKKQQQQQKKTNKTNKKKQQQQQQTNVSSYSRAFLEKKNSPKIQVKVFWPSTDILQTPHPDLELYLYVLEIHEHLLFKTLAPNGCFLKKKKKKQKQKKNNNNNNNNNNNKTITKKSK